jgi:hypothetical protein
MYGWCLCCLRAVLLTHENFPLDEWDSLGNPWLVVACVLYYLTEGVEGNQLVPQHWLMHIAVGYTVPGEPAHFLMRYSSLRIPWAQLVILPARWLKKHFQRRMIAQTPVAEGMEVADLYRKSACEAKIWSKRYLK